MLEIFKTNGPLLQMVHLQRVAMQHRHIPVLDSLFDRMNMLLWPRLKVIFDANYKSVETAMPRHLGRVSKNPHYVTRRLRFTTFFLFLFTTFFLFLLTSFLFFLFFMFLLFRLLVQVKSMTQGVR